jgi:CheY-like chemotaxis protein
MEAVGQLTGGVAHDFNNLLAVIMGNAELLTTASRGEAVTLAQRIVRAAQRGGELTQRLLAFSRRQPLRPQTIDLGVLARDMTELIERTLGETITVETDAAPGLWPALADPGQVENALLNLAINARDAMAGGGRLVIRCRNVTLDESYVAHNPEAEPGEYVMLAVRDTGGGMTREVREHAFEPFFTTKEVGQGSGLGLSMVYGFAQQSNGYLAIDSTPGAGTEVSLYLPRATSAAPVVETPPPVESPRGRGETVLVVEDDADVRAMTVDMVESLGYRVVAAGDAAAALETLAAEAVDLMLSDIVLPGGASGSELADRARERFPGLKVVFMSGYSADALRGRTGLPAGTLLLDKPFEKQALAKGLRDTLDG